MRNRAVAVILTISLFFAVALSGCGSSGRSRHPLLKSVVGAAVIHHVLKKRGSSHPLLKSVAAGAVIHHVLKKR